MAESKSRDFDFVEELGEHIEYAFSLRGLPDADGVWIAAWVKATIRKNRRGERVSIITRQPRHQHAREIKAEFDGTNLAEIMKRYGVSRSTVYRIARE